MLPGRRARRVSPFRTFDKRENMLFGPELISDDLVAALYQTFQEL